MTGLAASMVVNGLMMGFGRVQGPRGVLGSIWVSFLTRPDINRPFIDPGSAAEASALVRCVEGILYSKMISVPRALTCSLAKEVQLFPPV